MNFTFQKSSLLSLRALTFLFLLGPSLFLGAQENAEPDAKKTEARAKVFPKLDKDHNGSLSPEEFKAAPQFNDKPERASKVFTRLDKDGNGSLSKEEFTSGAPKKDKDKGGKKSAGNE